MVIPDTDEPWKRGSVSFATAVASWSTAMLAATTAPPSHETADPDRLRSCSEAAWSMAIDSVLLRDLGENAAQRGVGLAETEGPWPNPPTVQRP